MYRCETMSPEGFVQQLACNLVNHGYWHYVAGRIPPDKEPATVDRKLIAGYGLEMSKWSRARRKAKGEAKVSYLRHGRFFVLIATQGEHHFYRREGRVRDIRRDPIIFHGYSIGCSKGSDGRYHASVKIQADAFNERLAYFQNLATHRDADHVAREFKFLTFAPYARVKRQMLRIVKEVNELRAAAGFEIVPTSTINLRRTVVKVFRENGNDISRKAELEKLVMPVFERAIVKLIAEGDAAEDGDTAMRRGGKEWESASCDSRLEYHNYILPGRYR